MGCGSQGDSSAEVSALDEASSAPTETPSSSSLPDIELFLLCNIPEEVESARARISDFRAGTAAGIDVAESLMDLHATMRVASLPFNEDESLLTPAQIEEFEATQDMILLLRAKFINDPALPIDLAEEAVSAAQATFDSTVGADCTARE